MACAICGEPSGNRDLMLSTRGNGVTTWWLDCPYCGSWEIQLEDWIAVFSRIEQLDARDRTELRWRLGSLNWEKFGAAPGHDLLTADLLDTLLP